MNAMDYFAIGVAVVMTGCMFFGVFGRVHSFSVRKTKP